MAITLYSDADFDPIFKRKYLKLGDNLYTTYDNDFSRTKKSYDTLGSPTQGSYAPVETTFGGGYGGSTDGTLPVANHSSFINPVYGAKFCAARIQIDGRTIAASQRTEDAFVKAIDHEVTSKLRNFNRNMGRILWNDGTGTLGVATAAPGGTAAAPTLVILNTGNYKARRFHFEPNEGVNINSLGSLFTVTSYAESTRTLTLARVSGSDDIVAAGATTNTIYTQGCKDAEPYGFMGFFVNSSHYGVAEQARWEPYDSGDKSGAPLDTGMLTEMVEVIDTNMDESPTDIKFSPLQYRKYIKLLEDQKRFPVPVEYKPRPNKMTTPALIAQVSFGGIQYVGSTGNILCSKSKFIRDDMVFAVNFNHVETMHIQKPGWAQRDGTVFLRMEDRDAYEARYVAYPENAINPAHVGFIWNLSVA